MSPTCHADGVTYHAISRLHPLYTGGGRRSIAQALWFSLACLRLLFARFDVLEADHMPYFPLITLKLVAVIRRKRLLVTWHEYWGADYWRDYLGAGGVLGGLIESFATRLPDAIIAASPQTASRLREVVNPKIPILTAPNGVDISGIADVAPAQDGTDVIVVGRLLPHKRVDLLLDALAHLRDEGKVLRARIVGYGDEADNLAARAAALGISDQVSFEPSVRDQSRLFAMIKSARVAVFPSEREGFGIAVLEALACGVPVITTSAPDNLAQHLVRRADGAGIVCAPDAPALAGAIAAVLDGDRPAGQADRTWLSEYDWSAIADQVSHALLAPAAPVGTRI